MQLESFISDVCKLMFEKHRHRAEKAGETKPPKCVKVNDRCMQACQGADKSWGAAC